MFQPNSPPWAVCQQLSPTTGRTESTLQIFTNELSQVTDLGFKKTCLVRAWPETMTIPSRLFPNLSYSSHECWQAPSTSTDITGMAKRGHSPQKISECVVILCFERRYPIQDTVARLKSRISSPQKHFGLAALLTDTPVVVFSAGSGVCSE